MVFLTVQVARPHDNTDKQLIFDSRARSNAAILHHDVEGVMANIDSLYQLTAGSGDIVSGRDQYAELFKWVFSTEPSTVYVRMPDSVEISESKTLAFETGCWRGDVQDKEVLSGRYSAQWVKTDEGWRIRAELYVTLNQ